MIKNLYVVSFGMQVMFDPALSKHHQSKIFVTGACVGAKQVVRRGGRRTSMPIERRITENVTVRSQVVGARRAAAVEALGVRCSEGFFALFCY
jgi:hypothetical protein